MTYKSPPSELHPYVRMNDTPQGEGNLHANSSLVNITATLYKNEWYSVRRQKQTSLNLVVINSFSAR